MKYICINCKEEFDEIPEERNNECRSGYTHRFIKKTSILKRTKKRRR